MAKYDLDPVRQRIVDLIDERDTDLAKASRAIDRNHAYLQQFITKGTPRRLGEDDRRKLADFLGVPESDLGGPDTTPKTAIELPQKIPITYGRKDLPVFASAEGGKNGEMLIGYEPIEYRERPSILENVPDAYAMYVVNDSMEPRYQQGELLLIHPHKPVRPGNDVLLVKTDDGNEHHAMIKRLVRKNAREVVLLQFNPRREITVPASEVKNLHLVTGAYWQT